MSIGEWARDTIRLTQSKESSVSTSPTHMQAANRRAASARSAWSSPTVLTATAAPAFAASPVLGTHLAFDYTATNAQASQYGSGFNAAGYAGFLGTLTNLGTEAIPAGVQITATVTLSSVGGATRLDQGVWPGIATKRDASQWDSVGPLTTTEYVIVFTTTAAIAVRATHTFGIYVRNDAFSSDSAASATHASASMTVSTLPTGVINDGYTTVAAPEIVLPVASLTPTVVRTP